MFAFSRLKFVGKYHICWGNSPRAPGYASGAHATEIIFLHVSFRERAEFFKFCVENIRYFQ